MADKDLDLLKQEKKTKTETLPAISTQTWEHERCFSPTVHACSQSVARLACAMHKFARGGQVIMMVKESVKSTTTHHYIAIFKLGLPSDHRMMPWKLCDNISNGSGVITLTDKQTKSDTNGHYWKEHHPRYVKLCHTRYVSNTYCVHTAHTSNILVKIKPLNLCLSENIVLHPEWFTLIMIRTKSQQLLTCCHSILLYSCNLLIQLYNIQM